ncbi:MAG: URC4/urg3 family protein [Pseudomonadota bacterium]
MQTTGLNDRDNAVSAIEWLRTTEAIRQRAGMVLGAAERDELEHFAFDPERLDGAAAYVIDLIQATYPALDIPYHSRWRHFAAGGRDRWQELSAELEHVARVERARIRFDLAVVSVLLDAGAGDRWRYIEPSRGQVFSRSEGLAVASFDLFTAGLCSVDPSNPLRADADALVGLDVRQIERQFQVADDNPLLGTIGRARLMNALGHALQSSPALFGGDRPRIGHLVDYFMDEASDGTLPASSILAALLRGFGSIWPGRLEIRGVNLGDVGRHPAATADDLTDGFVPFHKLSQWLAYSLIEPLEELGIDVIGLDALTPLAEYRNGGLLIDYGLLQPKHEAVIGQAHPGNAEVITEWRALTVALIEQLAERIRTRLGLSPLDLPLAKILEGGTWAAGRRIAKERRPDGSPPITLLSDGTLF